MYNVLNWKNAEFGTPEGSKQIREAINYFMKFPRLKREKLEVDHFTLGIDGPTSAAPFIDTLMREVPADMAWSRVFDTLDLTAPDAAKGQSGFTVLAKGSGVVLAEVKPGQKAKVYQAQGGDVTIPFLLYGGGIEYNKTLIQDGRWWDLDSTFLDLRNAYNTNLANAHYTLLTAIGAGDNVAWQNPTPAALANTDRDYVIIRDANTIETAILQIITNANNWAGINKDAAFVVVCPLGLASRLRRALGTDMLGRKLLDFQVEIAPTTGITGTNYYVAPVRKAAKSGMRLDYEVEFDKDVLAYCESAVAWSRFGAAILSEACIARCATA